MKDVLAGIKVVEVAAWTFVPISGAVLSEWGADVIKVEPVEGGDPQRGLVNQGLTPAGGVNHMFEIPNRGKRSVAIDLNSEDGRELLYKIVEQADVFVTSFLPSVRQKLKIDLDHIRARNPKIIYVRGSGQGSKGEEINRGGLDGATFWGRGSLATQFTEPGAEWPVQLQAAFGDVLGGLTIAGAISAALLRRERTGVPSVVDHSLLALGMWAGAPGITAAKLFEGQEMPTFTRDNIPNPLVGTFRTKDDRYINLVLLQADRMFPDLVEHLDHPELLENPIFKDAATRYANAPECIKVLRGIFAERTYAEWMDRLKTLKGVWSGTATPLEIHSDPQVIANHYLENITTNSGSTFALPANPVQFDETPPQVTGAPELGQHTDEVLLELGLEYDEIIQHKVSGAIL